MSAPRLACSELGETSTGAPELWILHGILGSGRNWRTFGRRLTEFCPGWRVVLVDLRNHGDSHGLPGPHTVEACADDLAALASARGGAPRVLLGHSFGGKVALAYARQRPAGLAVVWVVDAVPGVARLGQGRSDDDTDVTRVLAALDQIALPLSSHDHLLELLTERGFSPALAGWMTTNLRRTPAGFVWRFDLAAVHEMLDDYARQDLWPAVDDAAASVHLVRAGRGDRWTRADDARLDDLQASGRAHILRIPESGHWVHVDAPEVLLAAVVAALSDVGS